MLVPLFLVTALASAPLLTLTAHANMPPPPSRDTETRWIIDGLLGDAPFAAWSATKDTVVFAETYAQEGTGSGLGIHFMPANGKAKDRDKSIDVYDPNTDMENESAKAAVLGKARVALKAELQDGDYKPLGFVAWPTAPGKGDDAPKPLPRFEVPSAKVTLEVKKEVVYATIPGVKGSTKLLDLRKLGPGDTHTAEVQGVFAAEHCPYLLVQVHFHPKDYTAYNAVTQSFVATIPTAPAPK